MSQLEREVGLLFVGLAQNLCLAIVDEDSYGSGRHNVDFQLPPGAAPGTDVLLNPNVLFREPGPCRYGKFCWDTSAVNPRRSFTILWLQFFKDGMRPLRNMTNCHIPFRTSTTARIMANSLSEAMDVNIKDRSR